MTDAVVVLNDWIFSGTVFFHVYFFRSPPPSFGGRPKLFCLVWENWRNFYNPMNAWKTCNGLERIEAHISPHFGTSSFEQLNGVVVPNRAGARWNHLKETDAASGQPVLENHGIGTHQGQQPQATHIKVGIFKFNRSPDNMYGFGAAFGLRWQSAAGEPSAFSDCGTGAFKAASPLPACPPAVQIYSFLDFAPPVDLLRLVSGEFLSG